MSSCTWGDPFGQYPPGILGPMVAFEFPLFVKAPVLLKVAAAPQRTQLEHGFGPRQAPSGAGDVEPVPDEMTAGTLDDTVGDRQAQSQVLVVAEMSRIFAEVSRHTCASAFSCRAAPDPGSHRRRLAGKHAGEAFQHPLLDRQ